MTNIKNIKYWEMREARNMYKDMQLAEDCAKELSVIYSKAAIYTAKQIEGIFNRFASKHHLTRDEAINLLSEADSRNFEKLLEAYKNKTGAQKREVLAELEAPAYKNRMKRLDDIDKSINKLINAIASKERDAINTVEKLVENRSSDRKQQIKYLDLLGKQNIPLSLSEFQNLKYNDKENWLLLQKYKRSRSSGKLSAFSTFGDYKKYHKIIQDEIVGRTTKDGVVIKSQSDYFIERVLGTTEKEGPQKNKKREGIEIEDVISALTDPEKITEKEGSEGKSRKYIGENVEVTLNPDTGNLIQTNPKKRE